MSSTFKLASVPACLSALSLTATPAAAADLPVVAPQVGTVIAAPAWKPEDDRAADRRHRGWGGRGWGRYDRDRIDAGDVIAGVAIIGVIAAIASAASNSSKNRDQGDYRYPDSRNSDDYRYRDRQDSQRGWGGEGNARGLNRAVDICVNAIERDQRVDSVNSVDRNGAGWTVTGALFNGAGFTCTIGADGKIEHIDAGSGYRSGEAGDMTSAPMGEDRQLGDDRYAAERTRIDNDDAADIAQAPTGAQPAYPGGPLPGEEAVDAEIDAGSST